MVLGLHHAQITIPRGAEEAGRRFYVGVLGLREVEKPAALAGRGGFWLRAGDSEVLVHVGTEDGVERDRTKAHLAYQVRGIDAWRRRMEGEGVVIDDSVPIPGFKRFEFRDPFGNRVELIEPVSIEPAAH